MVYTSMSSYPPFLYGGETFHFEGYSCHELKMLLYHFYSLVVIIHFTQLQNEYLFPCYVPGTVSSV